MPLMFQKARDYNKWLSAFVPINAGMLEAVENFFVDFIFNAMSRSCLQVMFSPHINTAISGCETEAEGYWLGRPVCGRTNSTMFKWGDL